MGASEKIIPLNIADIPKHTIANPIAKDISADENIGQITKNKPRIIYSNPKIFSMFTLSPPNSSMIIYLEKTLFINIL